MNGVPSVGVQVMIGSGKIEKQAVGNAPTLPSSVIAALSGDNSSDGNNADQGKNAAGALATPSLFVAGVASLCLLSSLL